MRVEHRPNDEREVLVERGQLEVGFPVACQGDHLVLGQDWVGQGVYLNKTRPQSRASPSRDTRTSHQKKHAREREREGKTRQKQNKKDKDKTTDKREREREGGGGGISCLDTKGWDPHDGRQVAVGGVGREGSRAHAELTCAIAFGVE